jgi:hypothetical protein
LEKLRLKEVMMELARLGSSVWRAHWPMQGPQALASTTPPMRFESLQLPIALYGIADLFGARRHRKFGFHFQILIHCLPGNRSGAVEVLVGGVGTGADEADFQFLRVIVFAHRLRQIWKSARPGRGCKGR